MESKEVLLFNQYKISLEKYMKEQSNSSRRKLVYWAIRSIPYIDEDDMGSLSVLIQLVNIELKKMTYKEFIQIFPIDKWYDGDKEGWKDYYYTINYIKEKGEDNLIEEPFELVLEYQNIYVELFAVQWMHYVDTCMKEETGIDLVEAFFRTEEYPKDSKGNLIGINKNGEVCKVANPHDTRPKLKVVK